MLYPSVNEIRKKADSRYTLVSMVSKRARMIVDNTEKHTPVADKPVSIAVKELEDGVWSIRRATSLPGVISPEIRWAAMIFCAIVLPIDIHASHHMNFRILNMLLGQYLCQVCIAVDDRLGNFIMLLQGLGRPIPVFHGDLAVKACLSV